jgi:ABC-type bacteriocin/lantibiotic exporter with double-glycine peptidase domain
MIKLNKRNAYIIVTTLWSYTIIVTVLLWLKINGSWFLWVGLSGVVTLIVGAFVISPYINGKKEETK